MSRYVNNLNCAHVHRTQSRPVAFLKDCEPFLVM